MKSKIMKAASLEMLLADDNWQPQIDSTAVQTQVRQYCIKFKTYQQCRSIIVGDIAKVELQSQDSFFNRIVKINIGKGFFDKELEDILSGMHLFQTAEVAHSKAGTIKVSITDIQRLVIPELTDALVLRSGEEGICTVQDFLKKIRRELAMEQVREKAFFYIDELIAQSEIMVDSEEIGALLEQEMERCRGIANGMDLVFDDMTEEELLGAVGQPNIPSFKIMLKDMMRVNICQALLFLYWQGRDPVTLPVIEDDVLDASCGASEYVVQKLLENLQLA